MIKSMCCIVVPIAWVLDKLLGVHKNDRYIIIFRSVLIIIFFNSFTKKDLKTLFELH
jgi:hypothetical protein